MSTRNLDALFAPRALALIGASHRPGSVGQVVTRNLVTGGFAGPLRLVNPRGGEILGLPAFTSIADLPEAPDLAVIATPAETVPGIVAQLGARGCRAAVVISGGFEGPGRPAELRQAMLDAARPHTLRIVGPNSLGCLSPKAGLNASFANRMPPPGRVALVSQSGAVAAAAMDWGPENGIGGFSHALMVGDCADVDVADLLDYLALDRQTSAILLYLEGVLDGRKFMSAARAAARSKPVAVLKAGRNASGAKAAFSHTGALAGAFAVYQAAFRRAGLLQVETLGELLQAGEAFAAGLSRAGDRLAILTNGGGAGVLTVDALELLAEQACELSAETLAALGMVAPANWSRRNPVDILGDAQPALYGETLKILLAAPEVDAVVVLNCPTAAADSTAAALAVAEAAKARRGKPVLTAWLGGVSVEEARRRLESAGIPAYETPEEAARTYAHLARTRRNRELLVQVPSAGEAPVDTAAARRVIERVQADGRMTLTDPEARAVLSAYGVPVVRSLEARTPEAAGEAARTLGGRVALKILSRDISHKSDVGGVRLDLDGPEAVAACARQMLEAIAKARPEAVIDGFVVEPMLRRPLAQELIAGVVQDATFGPLVMVGQGGVAVEVLADRALGFPPLNETLAREMIGRTQVSRLLAGYRDRPPADLAALAETLVALGRLAAEHPQIAELDVNPLLCDASGVLAVDARIGLRAPGSAAARLAILPYPAGLTRTLDLDGEPLTVRPIRPDDAERLREMVDACTPEDVRMRFSGGLRRLSPAMVVRFTQLDYDREMAFVAVDAAGAILGVGRLSADPEGESAEFALMVRSDRQGHGLGRLLLDRVLEYAQARGLKEVWGEIRRENAAMLALVRSLGFTSRVSAAPDVRLVKTLAGRMAPA